MPLMVNPDSGALLYSSGSLLAATASTPTPSSMIAVVSATPTAAGVNMTEILKEQAAMQASLDSTAPRNLLLCIGGLLLMTMLVSHPRFLARLFASLPRHSRADLERHSVVYPFDKEHNARAQRPTVVGGGDLFTGWMFRTGSSTSTLHTALHPAPHIAPLLSHLPYSSALLWTPLRILPNPFKSSMTLAPLYIIVSYLILIAFALIWKSDLTPADKAKGAGSDFYRTGLIATSQIPLAVALGVRGNLVGLCVGKGYEKLKILHKVVGRVTFLAATLHGAFYVNKWAHLGNFKTEIAIPFIVCGVFAWASLTLLALSSIPVIRRLWFGFFEVCHFIGIIGLLVGLCFHVEVAVPFCIAGIVIYSLSYILSLSKTRLAHAELVPLAGAATTLITVPSLRSGWRAGQHVRIRVPALGFPHGFESHPFTIASAPHGEGLMLLCKKAGDWTHLLYNLAADGDESAERGVSAKTTTTVILEGPYGGMGNTLLSSFSSTLLFAGGSGISHSLGVAQDLMVKSRTGAVRSRTIDLVWVVRTQEIAEPLMETLVEMVKDAKRAEEQCFRDNSRQPTALRIKIYVTRLPSSSPIGLLDYIGFEDDSSAEKEKQMYLMRNPSSASTMTMMSTKQSRSPLSAITVHPTRPNVPFLLSQIAEETIARHGREMTQPEGVVVAVCGPQPLVDDVRKSVRDVEGYKMRACGGIELEEEYFGF